MEEQKIYSWGHARRYNDFSNYFKNKFNGRVQKISIDAGFTCPNRDGSKGKGGCSYCNNKTFKPSYCNLENSVTSQINVGVQFFAKKYKEMRYVAYFQAYSNTYAPVEDLRKLYDEALAHENVIGLVIATRPDCLSDEIFDLLGSYASKCYVMLEMGVESCDENTLTRINRGHTYADSVRAIQMAAERGIHTCAHLILGLPGESRETILRQADEISKLPVDNIKLHQLQIHRGTQLEHEYAKNPESFNLFHNHEDYIDIVIEYIERLDPRIIIERYVSQSPKELLIAPKWGMKNFEFVAKVDKELEARDTYQGRLYKDPSDEAL